MKTLWRVAVVIAWLALPAACQPPADARQAIVGDWDVEMEPGVLAERITFDIDDHNRLRLLAADMPAGMVQYFELQPSAEGEFRGTYIVLQNDIEVRRFGLVVNLSDDGQRLKLTLIRTGAGGERTIDLVRHRP